MKKTLLMLIVSLFALNVSAQNYSNLYVVGAAFDCDWNAENAYLMDKKEDGIFTWAGNMKRGDFKFLLKTNPDVWINCLNAKIANEKIVIGRAYDLVYVENSRVTNNDYKFQMDNEGAFIVTVDTKKMTLTITNNDLISVSSLNGKGKRIVNIHSCSGKASDNEYAYKMLIGKENIASNLDKWAYKDDNPWVIFSLSGIYSIDKFGFRDGRIRETGANVKNIPEYKVYVSTTGIEEKDWVEVIHETNVGDQDVKLKEITPVEARYIKFVPVKDPDDIYVRIYGVDIHGTFVRPIDENIISTGKTIVDYHAAWGNRETPANILDGNSEAVPGADANNPWAFGKSEGNNGWVIIDLEDKYNITKVALIDSEEWLTGYKIYVSSFVGKDSDWSLILDKTFTKEQVRKEAVVESPAEGRYIKLEIPAEYQEGLARVRELEIYGTKAEKPGIETNHTDLKSAYELALWTVDYNTTQDGILKAGARYNGKWTRDLSINVWNGYAFLAPEIAKNSLLSLLLDGNEQLIGAEYWDKIIWVKGAYVYYQATGDEQFLEQILKSGTNTLKELENMRRSDLPVFDSEYGLFTGASVFNDGIAGYEAPVFSGNAPGGAVVSHPAHNKIKCLSTNCIYYEAYRLLAQIATDLGEDAVASGVKQKAADLKGNIRKHLFNEETGKLYYLVDQNGTQHEFQEGLGISFAVLFDIVTEDEAKKIIDDAYVTQYGLPSIYPHFARFNDEKPGRHNMMIWPFVNGFFADACLKTGNLDKYKFELFNLIDLGLNKGGNNFWEIYDPKDGAPDGGWQTGSHWGGLEHQTWSATGFLNMVWSGLAGIRLEGEKITFKPYLPEEITSLELTRLKYGNMLLNIKLEGKGTRIKEFRLNDQVLQDAEILRSLSGEQNLYILLEEGSASTIDTPSHNDVYSVVLKENNIRVSMLNGNVAESARLVDVSGKEVACKENLQGVFSIGENLSKGVYILTLKCNNVDYSSKAFLY